MIRSISVTAALISMVVFPWQFTALLVVFVAFVEPFLPMIVGVGMDIIYYAPHASSWPQWSLYGFGMALAVLFVRSRLQTSSMRG